MKKVLSFLLVGLLSLSLLVLPNANLRASAADSTQIIIPTRDGQQVLEGSVDYGLAEDLLELTNAARAENGISPLEWDSELEEYAIQRAAEAAISFNHIRPNGLPWYTIAPAGVIEGENLVMVAFTAENAMESLMSSPTHRANLLDAQHGTMAAGVFEYKGVNYWAQLFGPGGSPVLGESNEGGNTNTGNGGGSSGNSNNNSSGGSSGADSSNGGGGGGGGGAVGPAPSQADGDIVATRATQSAIRASSTNLNSDGSVSLTAILREAEAALAATPTGGVKVTVRGATSIRATTLEALGELAAEHNRTISLYADTLNASGSTVEGRLIFHAGQPLANEVKLGIHTTGSRVESLERSLEKTLGDVAVVVLDQQGAFGQTIQVAAKVDLEGLDSSSLFLYRYDESTGSYTLITGEFLDKTGYLHFDTDQGGVYLLIGRAL